MSNGNGNSSVQSIKKKFEQQILNNEKDNSHAFKSSSTSAYNCLVPRESRLKHCTNKNQVGSDENIVAKSALESCSKIAKDIDSESVAISEHNSEEHIVNFAFNCPQIDPKRKSQIRRKPAFRCTDNKHNQATDKECDNAIINNRSFLYKHASTTKTEKEVLKSPLLSSANLEKIENSFKNPPPSVLFALMKKSSPNVEHTQTKISKDSIPSENKTDDVNHMLRRLEQILKNDNLKKGHGSELLKSSDSIKHINYPKVNKNVSESFNPQSEVHQILSFSFTNNTIDENLQGKTVAAIDSRKCDRVNIPEQGSSAQNLPEYAISLKNRKTEPVYAEPFQFCQKKTINDQRTFKNCIQRNSNNIRLSVDEFSEAIDKRNSAYDISPRRQDLHYLCTDIYDIPTEYPNLPEVVDFNIIKKECQENQREQSNSFKKHCNDNSTVLNEKSSKENHIHYPDEGTTTHNITKPTPRPRNLKLLAETPIYCNKLIFEKENIEDNSLKMGDSGMSSMEASPDLEDIEISHTPSRSLTEKRKNYLTRVSSVAEYDWVENLRDKRSLNSCYTALRKKSAVTVNQLRKNEATNNSVDDRLFEACLLVGYNSLKKGYVKSVFPPEAKPPDHIEHLIFPQKYYSSALRCTKSKSLHNILQLSKTSSNQSTNNQNKNKSDEQSSPYALKNSASHYNFRGKLLSQGGKLAQDEQNYSVVLTDQNGIRKFGYCRKILPENSEMYLPLVYCIVTSIRAPGFYFKVLHELESRHGQTDYQQKSMLKQFYESRLPKPGQHLYIKIPKSPQKRPNTDVISDQMYKISDTISENKGSRRSLCSLYDGLDKTAFQNLNHFLNDSGNVNSDNRLNASCGSTKSFKIQKSCTSEYKASENISDFTDNYGKICLSKSLPKINNSSSDNENNQKLIHNTVQSHLNCDTESVKNILKESNSETIDSHSSNICDSIFKNPLILKSKLIDFQQNDFINECKNSLQKFDDSQLAKDMEYTSTKKVNLSNSDNQKNECPILNVSDSIHDEKFSIINSSLLENMQELKNFTEVVIKRPYDVRLENNELTVLFESLNVETIINVFGSLLIERKVVLVGESLSKLCACIEGLQSALYPFRWQHTLVTTLPHNLIEITNAPIPMLAGILCTDERISVDEGILVDTESSHILSSMKDENTLLPSALREKLKLSLTLVKNTTGSQDPTRNVLVGEAFLKFFVTCMQGYMECFHNGIFDKHEFLESQSNKQLRNFLEWFVETAMFSDFIKTKGKHIIESARNGNSNITHKSYEIDEFLDLSYEIESFNQNKVKIETDNSFYEMFDGRLMERNKNNDSTKSFLKNHKNMAKKTKTLTEKFKEFLHT